ncbi:hypothetical protein [Rhodothermus marinus]|uniref:Uncharacterized protein n=1 Tax=Rhodothermus marinus (strain ATCC 43812 / DSM 4252 / R-10) TaxID=518766 RepID=D0MEA0_RHOM4|nr:hypothetical protein [Rhodothermus marinus]ACY47324.1 hypothetical protein Rmar_0420 [Rhodothermus marinus DSM 4252]
MKDRLKKGIQELGSWIMRGVLLWIVVFSILTTVIIILFGIKKAVYFLQTLSIFVSLFGLYRIYKYFDLSIFEYIAKYFKEFPFRKKEVITVSATITLPAGFGFKAEAKVIPSDLKKRIELLEQEVDQVKNEMRNLENELKQRVKEIEGKLSSDILEIKKENRRRAIEGLIMEGLGVLYLSISLFLQMIYDFMTA